MKDGHDILRYFSDKISSLLEKYIMEKNGHFSEIRLSAGSPVGIRNAAGCSFLGFDGTVTESVSGAVICSREDIEYSFRKICDGSVFSFENEIKEGFITLPGGHRVGICGTAVVSDGKILSVSEISGMNFRIARQVYGCSDEIFEKIKSYCPCGILVAGAPLSGKTTFLRDLCRNLSGRYRISLIDERQEIAAVYKGVPQNDIGPGCDVFSCYPKDKAAETAIRVMSPDILICDEIGNSEDAEVLRKAMNSGISIIASVHAGSPEELKDKAAVNELLRAGMFKFIVFMEPGTRRAVNLNTDEIMVS